MTAGVERAAAEGDRGGPLEAEQVTPPAQRALPPPASAEGPPAPADELAASNGGPVPPAHADLPIFQEARSSWFGDDEQPWKDLDARAQPPVLPVRRRDRTPGMVGPDAGGAASGGGRWSTDVPAPRGDTPPAVAGTLDRAQGGTAPGGPPGSAVGGGGRGLPQRVRRASLAPGLAVTPGDAAGSGAPAPAAPARSPDDVRTMMSAFQSSFGRGLRDAWRDPRHRNRPDPRDASEETR